MRWDRTAVAVAILTCFGAANLFGAASEPPHLVIMTGALDLGAAVPGNPISTSPPQIPEGQIQVLMNSDVPWTLLVSAERDGAANPIDSSDVFEIRLPGRAWTRMRMQLPFPMATGASTPPGGDPLVLEVRATATMDSPPGARRVKLRFSLQGEVDSRTVSIGYYVPAVTKLSDDFRPFTSPALDPSRRGIYPYEQRTYLVISNVPWVLEATLLDTPKTRTGSMTLPQRSLVVVDPGGSARALIPNVPLNIASGGPTGPRPQSLQLQLAVKIDDELLVGGEYVTQVVVAARAATLDSRISTAATR